MPTPDLGKWSGDDLAGTVSANSGSRYYADFPKLTQFAHSVAKVLSARRVRSPITLDSAPSVYVLGDVPQVDLPKKREPIFSAGATEVAGRVWFGAESMSSCNCFVLPSADADEVFKFVDEVLKAGDQPAIYFDGAADPHVMRLYIHGLGDDQDPHEISLDGALLSQERLKDLLDTLHKRVLVTPTASGAAATLWENGPKAYPAKESERTIQNVMETSLALALGAIRVRRENTGVSGRFDLGLVEQQVLDPSQTTNHALLELKVVKTYTHTGNNVAQAANRKAITKGVKQAGAYKKEHGFRMSALCCFDMQKTHTLDKCCEHETALAKKLGVDLWVWPLFSTTEAYRDAEAANA